MKLTRWFWRAAPVLICVAAIGCGQPVRTATEEATNAGTDGANVPQFRVDPFWPKTLPDEWLIGRIAGMAVDAQDRIFVVHRPGSLTKDELGLIQEPPMSLCCRPAPPVLVFDAEGNLLKRPTSLPKWNYTLRPSKNGK